MGVSTCCFGKNKAPVPRPIAVRSFLSALAGTRLSGKNGRMRLLAAIVLAAICGGICIALLRPPSLFVIRLSGGEVRFRGKFPMARRSEVETFLKREFGNRRISISGVKSDKGGIRFVIRGRLTDGDRQRIRNFLQMIVR